MRQPCVKDHFGQTALCPLTKVTLKEPSLSDSLITVSTHEGDFERTVSVRQPCVRDRFGQAVLCSLTD